MRLGLALLGLMIVGTPLRAAGDYYETLGVSRTASFEAIKQAHRRLARQYHPDLNSDPAAAETFKRVQEAYEILSDADLRGRYDRGESLRPAEGDEVWRAYRDRAEARRWDNLDAIGRKYTNDKWVYDPVQHAFYDNRVGKWLKPSLDGGVHFYSEEGWIFHPSDGTYLSTLLGNAEWNPSDSRGWGHYDNLNGIFYPIDERTGLPRSHRYRPRTVSDTSALFDELFNPASYRRYEGLNEILLEKLRRLPWAAPQKADFGERARASLEALQAPFFRHVHSVALMEDLVRAVFGNPWVLDHPELIETFPLRYEAYIEPFAGDMMTQRSWLTDARMEPVYARLVESRAVRLAFIEGLTRRPPGYEADLLRKALPRLRRHMEWQDAGALLGRLGALGPHAFDELAPEMERILESEAFVELICRTREKHLPYVAPFLSWAEKSHPAEIAVYRAALGILSPSWNADRTESETARRRRDYIHAHYPHPQPCSAALAEEQL